MSFIGAVATSVRQVLAQYAKDVHLPCLIVGAGNFTVPSVLRSAGFAGTITACDVTLYTSALGAYLSGWTLEAREREDCPEHLRGLLRTGSPLELTASISLLMDLREVWKGDNAFKMRMVEHSREAWDTLMEKTCARLEGYKAHIGPIDYQARDGFDLLEKSASGHTVFAFPPTYKAGYEKLEALLRATVEWTPPAYREMTDKSLELFEAIARFDSYYVVLEKDLPEVYALLGQPSAVLPRGRGRTTYIVAKHAKKVVIRSSAKTAPVGPIWPANRAVSGDEVPGFAPVKRAQSLRLNELYLAKRIDYFDGGVDVCIVLTLDGQVIGKADFMKTSHAQWKLPEGNPVHHVRSRRGLGCGEADGQARAAPAHQPRGQGMGGRQAEQAGGVGHHHGLRQGACLDEVPGVLPALQPEAGQENGAVRPQLLCPVRSADACGILRALEEKI